MDLPGLPSLAVHDQLYLLFWSQLITLEAQLQLGALVHGQSIHFLIFMNVFLGNPTYS